MSRTRIYSTLEGFEENYIEFDDTQRWTRSEVMEANNASEDQTLALLHDRASGCHLELKDGSIVTDIRSVTGETLDQMFVELIGFIGGAISNYLRNRQVLGNVRVRPWSDSNGTGVAPKSQRS